MTKRHLSIALAIVHALIGAVPLVTLRGIHRSNDSAMAWGVMNAMLVAPIWLAFVVASLVVDLRRPRTIYATLGLLAFPIGFVAAALIAG